MSSGGLQNCPVEVVESIASSLDLKDVRNLRLCARSIRDKVAQRFTSYLRHKYVELTKSALHALAHMTAPGKLGCEIQHLVLVGIVYDPDLPQQIIHGRDGSGVRKRSRARYDLDDLEQERAEQEQLYLSHEAERLLSTAFSNLAANRQTSAPLTLELTVAVCRGNPNDRQPPISGGDWRLVWQAAADASAITMSVLATSGLQIQNLTLFNDRQLQRCSLSRDELDHLNFHSQGLQATLAEIKSLSMSLSDAPSLLTRFSMAGSGSGSSFRTTSSFGQLRGFAQILEHCRTLENLYIHQYSLKNRAAPSKSWSTASMLEHAVTTDLSLRHLRRLELRGLVVSETDLLAFIQRTSVCDLTLYEVSLATGSFRPIFDYCVSVSAQIEKFYFYRLIEGHEELEFGNTTPVLTRAGIHVNKEIEYHYALPQQGSPAPVPFRGWHMREYGSPDPLSG